MDLSAPNLWTVNARVVDLMDACRAAGVERIGIVTRVAARGA